MSNVVLIGFMGSGKTSLGKLLAQKQGKSFIDMDILIEEQTGKKISVIFEEEGEAHFRRLETQLLEELAAKEENAVISTGGGLPMKKHNHQYLKKLGTVIYLKANAKTLEKRLEGDSTRPLLAGDDPGQKIAGMLAVREMIYQQAADITIVTDGKSLTDIIEEMEEILNENSCH